MKICANGVPKVIVITPVFNEAEGLSTFESRVRSILMASPRYDVHVLFVDDGSVDSSWSIIQEISQQDGRFQGLRLSRNFGPHTALTAGLQHCSGDAIVLLACDLQDPPEVVLEFLDKWSDGADIVWGKRRQRADVGWRVAASKVFEFLTRRFAMPKGSKFTTGSFLLMDKCVHKCFLQFQEQNRVTFALVAWTGFDQEVVEYDRQVRIAGKSSWNFSKMLKAAYDTFLSFSKVPFGLITALGVALSLVSVPFAVYLLACYAMGNPQPGWTSIMLVIVFFFGIHFLFLSVIGEYLARIYAESVRRPLYFVSRTTAKLTEGTYESNSGTRVG